MGAFTPQDLKLAIGHHLASRLLARDGAVDPDESVFLERAFPPSALAARGFLRGALLTPRYHDAVEQGLRALPGMALDDRLDLAEALWRAVEVDGRLDPAEADGLAEALAALGLTRAQLDARLGLSPTA